MSTFKGIVAEFPLIRIDYFRHQPEQRAPLACFLSHVHSDHLTGLESLRAPFVYCSAATREILLRLEKYHYRINYARGILESRNVTYDRTMRKLAKPLPLDTPTEIELGPENKIRVTLLDANHCIGAVMFLIEGQGKAILYTGDIRAEVWWVNSLVQNPVLLPYTLGSRRLDCIYLDTTFATKSEPYREFPSKAEGIRELLESVEKCSKDTVFYFHSWTFGYEDVWIALSAFLQSQIHLDWYRAQIYGSLSPFNNESLRDKMLLIHEAPALCGFRNGNHIQAGCLTSQSNVRIHSCERGMSCPVIDQDTNAEIVHIIPIIARVNGTELAEIGAGGGKGDLNQKEELEAGEDVGRLMELCASEIKDPELLSGVLKLLEQAFNDETGEVDLGLAAKRESQNSEDELSLRTLVSVLATHVAKPEDETRPNRVIKFPYSRHSSYSELCILVDAFKPGDVYPCTVDPDNWTPAMSMRTLFGQHCATDADSYCHDAKMLEVYESRIERERRGKRNAETQMSDCNERLSPTTPKKSRTAEPQDDAEDSLATEFATPNASFPVPFDYNLVHPGQQATSSPHPRLSNPPTASANDATASAEPPSASADWTASDLPTRHDILQHPSLRSSASSSETPTSSFKPTKRLSNKELAYNAVLGFGLTWADYGGLVCTQSATEREEPEL
ncbi:hypothetical protein K491DRAFT_692337 [Lophiostoma macrostomum CBS 122681]|uniref:Protein artemis n=1 Tax=Lophiostoma macrostomum CBS 122681 TaxID=1314788 RepID=A0A6A6T818_9PLEO|nr:hypothetical protein K491DRAFT_692337 [Lophiostoma macrostomum CBS 122681]